MSQDDKVQANTTSSGQCPVLHGGNTEMSGGPMAWWPNALNLDILHQHDKKLIQWIQILIMPKHLLSLT